MRVVKEKANAKINLYLDVISKREDGFHDIKSIMHSISLCDNLTVSAEKSEKTSVKIMNSGSAFLPIDDKNLAVQAAKLFLESAGICAQVKITLDKRIPIAAGLAGGSSDAAATLRAMNKIFGRIFTERALYKMGQRLGSDVPYCLYGKTALCEGRGEIITKLPDKLKLNFVIAVSNEHISTPKAYTELDSIFSSFDGSVKTESEKFYDNIMNAVNSGVYNNTELYNIFEASVLPKCAGAEKIKKFLHDKGALSALMSGSGPSVYGIFPDEKSAVLVCDELNKNGVEAFFATSV